MRGEKKVGVRKGGERVFVGEWGRGERGLSLAFIDFFSSSFL